MKLFLDTANLKDIEEALDLGIIEGITTNPSLFAKEPKSDYIEHLAKIVALANKYGGRFSLSVEVFSDEPADMIAQAEQFVKALGYKELAVKVHVSYRGTSRLNVVRELAQRRIAVNCTACMTPMQAMMAAAAGAKYVSLFYNRIRDGKMDGFAAERKQLLDGGVIEQTDFDPDQTVRETRALLENYPGAEIIAGSIRTVLDVKHAGLAGAHIVTAGPKILKKALEHYKTDEAVGQFLSDFAKWLAPDEVAVRS
jgi:transaldolase